MLRSLLEDVRGAAVRRPHEIEFSSNLKPVNHCEGIITDGLYV